MISKKELQEIVDNKQEFIEALEKENRIFYNDKEELKKQVAELKSEIKELESRITILTETTSSQQAVIDFLTREKFGCGEDIEFAAIKRYRGWDCLYLNGKKIDTDHTNSLSIYYDANEPIKISEDRV